MSQPACILLDIEGTTSSIRFVYEVMFPYIRNNIATFLQQNWDSAVVVDCLPLLADESGNESVAQWLDQDLAVARSQVEQCVLSMMAADVKATGLKKLQGAIWKQGFETGQLVAHVYDDVAPALREWTACGLQVRVYSSGSVEAQKLFFSHSVAGNLLPLFSGHYDTTIGSKKSPQSYRTIARDIGVDPQGIVFISDVVEELEAADQAGLTAVLSVRPGNPVVTSGHGFCSIHHFNELDLSLYSADAQA